MKTRKEMEYSGLFRKLSEWSQGIVGDDEFGDEFGDVDWHEMSWQSERVDLGDLRFRTVENYGGEGQGDRYWFVFEVEYADQIVHYRVSGYYASYDGGYYEEIQIVTPKDKMIVVWEAV